MSIVYRGACDLPSELASSLRKELVVVETKEKLDEEGTGLLVADSAQDREQQVRLTLEVLRRNERIYCDIILFSLYISGTYTKLLF